MIRIVKSWQESVVGLDKMVYEDAKKEFSLSSMTGFGADGSHDEMRQDFEQVRGDFESLLQGKGVILPEHKEVFAAVYARLPKKTTADWTDKFGFSGEYMEARIFADMACCKILNRPFSLPETTGCRTPTVGGIYVLPDGGGDYLLTELLQRCGNPARPEKNPLLWSRAAKGWQKSFAAAGENV